METAAYLVVMAGFPRLQSLPPDDAGAECPIGSHARIGEP